MEEKIFYNTCPAAGCHHYCALKLWVKDGKIRKVESADYPGNPAQRFVCLKGLSSARLIYDPHRLKYPLKRVGERGEGKWHRISWDEALDTIAGKLLEIKDKYGAQAVKLAPGGKGSSTVGLLMGKLLQQRFANAWGAGGDFETKGNIADTSVYAAGVLTLGRSGQTHRVHDYARSRMIIIWGGNTAETYPFEMRGILEARENGAKLVVIGPVFTPTVAKADQWIPLRPATDAALALAMINTIIENKRYDADYVTKCTVGPFLVGEDSGLFLREGSKYLVWDEADGTAKPLDEASRPALRGNFTVHGISCKPAFQLLSETAALYAPDKAAGITGVSAQTIKELALEYAASKPAAIRLYHGMGRTRNSTLACRAVMSLAAITGNIGVEGGGAAAAIVQRPPVLNERAVIRPAGSPGMKTLPDTKSAMRGWKAIREGKPDAIKALLIAYQNPVHCYGHIDGYLEIFSQMELIVVSDIFMTLTARYADIVLPEATTFERDDIIAIEDYIIRTEKAIEPLYESRSALDILSDLARRVGLGQYFEYTAQDYIKVLLDSGNPAVAGITPERLEKEKIVRLNVPQVPPVPFADRKFPTPSGKIEFYVEQLAELGQGLPVYQEALESPRSSPLVKDYPLTLLTIKRKTFMHTLMHSVDWMREIDPEPRVDINPADASTRGIKENDLVTVFNARGKAKLKARLSETVPPGVVNIGHGWWPEQFAEGHYSYLMQRIDDLDVIDPALEREPITSDPVAGVGLVYYDCLVEVKKG